MTAKEMAKYMAYSDSEENFILVKRDTFYAMARELKKLKIILETIDKIKNM